MNDGRLRRFTVLAVIVAVVLFVLAPVLALAGAPIEIVGGLSMLSFLAVALAFVLLVVVASRRLRWSLVISSIALAAEIGAALLLLVQEPQPYLHPEWAWYWPVVNTLYFGGLALTLVALISTGIAFISSRTTPAGAAFLIAVGALVVNRLAPYR